MRRIILLLCFCMILHNVFSQDTLKTEKLSEQNWGYAAASASKLISQAVSRKLALGKIKNNPVEFMVTSIAVAVGKGGVVNSVYFPSNIPKKMAAWYNKNSISNGIKEIEPIKLARFENKTLLVMIIFTEWEENFAINRFWIKENVPKSWPDFIVENETEVILLKPTVITVAPLRI